MLLLQADESGLLLDVSLFQITAEFSNLSLAFLVQFNLGRGGSGGLSKTLSHVLKLTRQVGSLSLSLSTSLPLGLKLLFHLFNSCLVFLDTLLNLGNKGLFIIKLGQKSTGILLLALDCGLQLLPGPLEIAH